MSAGRYRVVGIAAVENLCAVSVRGRHQTHTMQTLSLCNLEPVTDSLSVMPDLGVWWSPLLNPFVSWSLLFCVVVSAAASDVFERDGRAST